MPEGPEVTFMTYELNKRFKGCQLIDFIIHKNSRYFKKAPDGFDTFHKLLDSCIVRIECIENKGKFIYWIMEAQTKGKGKGKDKVLTEKIIMFNTLGMAGGWFDTKYNHSDSELNIKCRDSTSPQTLFFNDSRHFGTFKFLFESQGAMALLEKKLKELGPDILDNKTFTMDVFKKILEKKTLQKKPIGTVITDQKVISGVGNYLRAEILYHAKISPHKTIESFSEKDKETLFHAIVKRSHDSLKAHGATIQKYSNLDKSYKHKFKEFNMEVYGKQQTKDGHRVIMEKIGRDTQNTYWCPTIQKE